MRENGAVAPWRRTLYATWIAQILAMSGFWMVMPFLAVRIRELSGTDVSTATTLTGWAGFAAGMAMTGFAPVWGALADRYGRKAMILRAMLAGAVVMTLMGFMKTVGGIIFCRALQGMLTGSITASVTLVSSVTPTRHSGYALGMIHGAVYSGIFIGPLLGGVVCDRFSFQTSCIVAGGILTVATLLVLFGAREEFKPIPKHERGERDSYKALIGTKGFFAAILAIFIINFGVCVTIPVFQFFVEDLAGNIQSSGVLSQKLYSAAEYFVRADTSGHVAPGRVINTLTGTVFGFAGIASAGAAILLGRFGDRWGHWKILTLCAILAGLITIPHIFATSIGELFLLRLGYGFVSAGIVPSANAIIRRVVRQEHVGRAYGLSTSVGALGWALGPLTGGYVGKHSLRSPFLITAIMLLAVGLYVALFLRPRPQPARSAP